MSNYKKAYSLTNHIGPLKKDCGKICLRACCESDKNRGMLLFPGEEELFHSTDDSWYNIKDTNIILSDGSRIKLFTCKGKCAREKRPLACRIFPLMPYITEKSILEIRLDPKSVKICPLSYDVDKYQIQEEFIDSLYDVFELLIENDNVLEFINILSEDYDRSGDLI